MARSLYDCPQIPVGPDGVPCRVVVATHPAGKKKSPVGVTRAGVVYELFFANLPQLSRPVEARLMKLFGEALEKRASLCYTFRMKYAKRLQRNAYHTFTSITRWA